MFTAWRNGLLPAEIDESYIPLKLKSIQINTALIEFIKKYCLQSFLILCVNSDWALNDWPRSYVESQELRYSKDRQDAIKVASHSDTSTFFLAMAISLFFIGKIP